MLKTANRKYYLFNEIVIHNKIDDIWIVINDKVLDLTDLFRNVVNTYDKLLLNQLLIYAGKDISHFFDKNTKPLEQISLLGKKCPLLLATLIKSTADQPQQLHQYHQQSNSLNATMKTTTETAIPTHLFWWNNPKYEIGFVTKHKRQIRIINTLTHNTILLSVCDEDTIRQIQQKYNEQIQCLDQLYVWCKNSKMNPSKRLNENGTLVENGFTFEGQHVGYHPSIWLFYISDFRTIP